MCSENKGADQLHSYREADLRLCFRICKMLVFCCFFLFHIFFYHAVYPETLRTRLRTTRLERNKELVPVWEQLSMDKLFRDNSLILNSYTLVSNRSAHYENLSMQSIYKDFLKR